MSSNQTSSPNTQNSNNTDTRSPSKGDTGKPDKSKDRYPPLLVSAHLEHYSLTVMGILLVLMVLIGVCLYFMYTFSNKFYKIVSSGQESLCNFYTCSGPGDCDNMPKIILPDGKQVCIPQKSS